MKSLMMALCTAFLAISFSYCSLASASRPVWWYTPQGKAISLSEAVAFLQGYDVVMFGEYHDQTAIHEEQLAFLQSWYAVDQNLMLSLEMIEKDDDELLQKYLLGEVTQEFFLENSRPWKNYRVDYAPMVNFCKDQRLDVIAANIPRYLANQYAKEGTLDKLPADKRHYLPRVHLTKQDRYFEEFTQVMGSTNGSGMQVPAERVWNFYRAQCLKDDVMAQSIFDYLQQHAGSKVLHMQGSFHGRYHLGVADKLHRLAPAVKIAVISPVYIEDDADKAQIAVQHRQDGDLLLLVKQIQASP